MTEPLTPLRVPRPLQERFAAKPMRAQAAIAGCFHRLRVDWRHPGLRSKKLKGRRAANGQPVYAARASRGDRVTFFWDGPRIVIENHCSHDIL